MKSFRFIVDEEPVDPIEFAVKCAVPSQKDVHGAIAEVLSEKIVSEIIVKTPKEGQRMTWREQPATEKQLEYISDIMEFSAYPVPRFTGTTKGEAADFINKYGKMSHEDISSKTYGY